MESYYNTIGYFPCTVASFTPIRVVTKEVRYFHDLSLTLEHSIPISSPAAPGLTRPTTRCLPVSGHMHTRFVAAEVLMSYSGTRSLVVLFLLDLRMFMLHQVHY